MMTEQKLLVQPRMVVIPVEPTPPSCVVSWTPYHPKAGETVEVFLRKDLSSIDPEAITFPSGLKATLITSSLCPLQVLISLPF